MQISFTYVFSSPNFLYFPMVNTVESFKFYKLKYSLKSILLHVLYARDYVGFKSVYKD